MTLVFVYGTLKRGEPNHKVLIESIGSQKFLGTGKTVEKYPLVVGTKYNIPFLLNQPGDGNHIEGEIYEIDDKKLEILDELEAYPTLYDRKICKITLSETQKEIEAFIYLLKSWRSDLLATSSAQMSNYSSLGPHLRPYVDRYVRAKEMLFSDEASIYSEILGSHANFEDLTRLKAEFDLKKVEDLQ